MLRETGAWMKINGEAIYGSRAWVRFGEGTRNAKGILRTLPSGQLGKDQAHFRFGPKDFRFTTGSDGSIYAFALSVPHPLTRIKIASLGTDAGLLKSPVSKVTLLGSSEKLIWHQDPDGLVIVCPSHPPSQIAITFHIQM
jgi:alpha-L-fucosidase